MSHALASFRDPGGTLFSSGPQIFRKVSPVATVTLRRFLNTKTAQNLIRSGKIVNSEEVSFSYSPEALNGRVQNIVQVFEEGGCVLEHNRVWFPSYPYEWQAEMLFAAGNLTLELVRSLLDEHFGLKDATPYNLLFQGPNPIFVDVLSFEEREAGDARWLPYAQFVRMFIFPLLMNREFGMRTHQTLLAHGEGVDLEYLYKLCSWSQRLRPPFLGSVSAPAWLNQYANSNHERVYQSSRQIDPEKAEFILKGQFGRLHKLLQRAAPPQDASSTWSPYTNTFTYNEEQFDVKTRLVREWMDLLRPKTVLDVGCNTGVFSEIAATAGAQVVAIDTDAVVAGQTWRRAKEKNLNILPLVLNLARPSPAIGWCNAECASFLQRAQGSFEMILMLAVLHHLLVTERVPLPEILRMVAQLGGRYLIIEYVSKDDPMFHKLARGRDALHADFTQEYFESTCQKWFTIARKQQVQGDLRWLYLLENRGDESASY
jgi:SAM-dependent methyltransferase